MNNFSSSVLRRALLLIWMKIVFPLYCKIFFDLLVRNIFPAFDEFLFCLCLVSLLTFKEIATIHFFQDNGLMTFFLILFVDCFLKFFILYFFSSHQHIFWYVWGFYFNFSVFWRYMFPLVFIPGLSIYGLDFLRQLRVTWYCSWLLWLHSDSQCLYKSLIFEEIFSKE